MLRRLSLAGALVGALVLTAPATASAQSCVPKGWQVAAAQLEYDLAREAALTEQHTRTWLATPQSSFGGATVAYAGQRVVSTGFTVQALARFGAAVLQAPPTCR